MDKGHIGAVLLREAEHLAREKFLDKKEVLDALEEAFQKISETMYGEKNDIRVSIDQISGNINVMRHKQVVENVNDPFTEISKEETDIPIGEEVIQEVPLKIDRSSLQIVKQLLMKKLYEIERERQFEEFKDRVGEVITGIVKRIEFRNPILDIGRAEGIIFHNELIKKEAFRIGDRVKAYIYAVEDKPRGAQIFLSRSHPQFLAKLFIQEVPEMQDNVVEIKNVARDPGSRAKVAVYSHDSSIDVVGTCVGVRGNRVNAVSQELQGEKIDVIPWASDLAAFVVNALTPAEVVKVIVEGAIPNKLTVVVPDDQQSIAIGRRGQNVELAHQLTGCSLDIVSESEEGKKSAKERSERVFKFMEQLDIDEIMAHLLISEGFESIQEIAETPAQELEKLQGFTEELGQELKERAREAFEEEINLYQKEFLESGGDKNMFKLKLPFNVFSLVASKDIKTLQELADLSLDELKDIIKKDAIIIADEAWGNIIMKARELCALEKDQNDG